MSSHCGLVATLTHILLSTPFCFEDVNELTSLLFESCTLRVLFRVMEEDSNAEVGRESFIYVLVLKICLCVSFEDLFVCWF